MPPCEVRAIALSDGDGQPLLPPSPPRRKSGADLARVDLVIYALFSHVVCAFSPVAKQIFATARACGKPAAACCSSSPALETQVPYRTTGCRAGGPFYARHVGATEISHSRASPGRDSGWNGCSVSRESSEIYRR